MRPATPRSPGTAPIVPHPCSDRRGGSKPGCPPPGGFRSGLQPSPGHHPQKERPDMFTVIEHGEVYDPEPRGRASLLVVGDRIARIGEVDADALRATGLPC